MSLHIRIAKLAAVGSVVIGMLGASNSTIAEELENLGPVGPYDGIFATMGSAHVIAFFEPANGRCAVNAVIWDDMAGDPGEFAKRVRVSIDAGDQLHFETVAHGTLNLKCGKDAATLGAVDTESLTASGITAQPERRPATPPQ